MAGKLKDAAFLRQVGRRVVETREALPEPMSQKQLAAALKVIVSKLNNWERGQHLFPVEYAVQWRLQLRTNLRTEVRLTLDWIYAGELSSLDYPLQRAILMRRENSGKL